MGGRPIGSSDVIAASRGPGRQLAVLVLCASNALESKRRAGQRRKRRSSHVGVQRQDLVDVCTRMEVC
jgi:hypothetical protein